MDARRGADIGEDYRSFLMGEDEESGPGDGVSSFLDSDGRPTQQADMGSGLDLPETDGPFQSRRRSQQVPRQAMMDFPIMDPDPPSTVTQYEKNRDAREAREAAMDQMGRRSQDMLRDQFRKQMDRMRTAGGSFEVKTRMRKRFRAALKEARRRERRERMRLRREARIRNRMG